MPLLTLSIHLCQSDYILPCYLPKQLYLLINKSNKYIEGHPTSIVEFYVSNSTTLRNLKCKVYTQSRLHKTFYNPNLWKSHQRGNTPSKAHVNGMFRAIKKQNHWILITRLRYKSKNHILSEPIHLQLEEYPVCHFSNFYLCILVWLKWFHNEAEKPFFTHGKCYWLIISYEDYIWIFIFPWKWINYFRYNGEIRRHRVGEKSVSLWPVQGLSLSSAGLHAQQSVSSSFFH